MKIKKILTFIQIILILVSICCIFLIIKWFNQNNETEKIVKDISNSVKIIEKTDNENEEPEYQINFEELKSKNPDTVAFVKVNETNIEYPVVKTDNNSYYLTHNFEKKDSSAGWIFADYQNSLDGTDRNLVIYGHNRHDDSMFGSLKNILQPEWYDNENNKNVLLITENETATYEVFSIYQIEKEDYYIKTNFNIDAQFLQFVHTITARSIHDFGVKVCETDKILTLSTCANNNKYRIVLHAKKL